MWWPGGKSCDSVGDSEGHGLMLTENRKVYPGIRHQRRFCRVICRNIVWQQYNYIRSAENEDPPKYMSRKLKLLWLWNVARTDDKKIGKRLSSSSVFWFLSLFACSLFSHNHFTYFSVSFTPLILFLVTNCPRLHYFPCKHNTFRKRVKNAVTSKGIQAGVKCKKVKSCEV
jgi:hypothetical protein